MLESNSSVGKNVFEGYDHKQEVKTEALEVGKNDKDFIDVRIEKHMFDSGFSIIKTTSTPMPEKGIVKISIDTFIDKNSSYLTAENAASLAAIIGIGASAGLGVAAYKSGFNPYNYMFENEKNSSVKGSDVDINIPNFDGESLPTKNITDFDRKLAEYASYLPLAGAGLGAVVGYVGRSLGALAGIATGAVVGAPVGLGLGVVTMGGARIATVNGVRRSLTPLEYLGTTTVAGTATGAAVGGITGTVASPVIGGYFGYKGGEHLKKSYSQDSKKQPAA